jgi:hypothetical protein
VKTAYDIWLPCVGEGWHSLVRPLIDMAAREGAEITQVKEKFGGLRFYVGPASDELYEAIDRAEAASLNICEVCGQPGELRNLSWLRTLCEEHYKHALGGGDES